MQEARIRIKIDTKQAERDLRGLNEDVSQIERDGRSRVGKGGEKKGAVGGGRGMFAPAARLRERVSGMGIGSAVGSAAMVGGAGLAAAAMISKLTPIIQGIIKEQIPIIGEAVAEVLGLPKAVIDFLKSEVGGRVAASAQTLSTLTQLAKVGITKKDDEQDFGEVAELFRKAAIAQSRYGLNVEAYMTESLTQNAQFGKAVDGIKEAMVGDITDAFRNATSGGR